MATPSTNAKAEEGKSEVAMHSLPQIPQVRGEEQLRRAVEDYLSCLEASSDQKLDTNKLATVLKEAWPLKDGDLPMLYMYKYPLRSALEKLQTSDPLLSSLGTQAQEWVDKQGHWNVQAKAL